MMSSVSSTLLKIAAYKELLVKTLGHVDWDIASGQVTVKDSLFQDDIKRFLIESSEGNLHNVNIIIKNDAILVISEGKTNGISYVAKHAFSKIHLECSSAKQSIKLTFAEKVEGKGLLDRIAISAAQTLIQKTFLEKLLSDKPGIYFRDNQMLVRFAEQPILSSLFEKELLGLKLPALFSLTLDQIVKGQLIFKIIFSEELLTFIDRFLPELKLK